MIVGTAGHIDHGKTALVRRLTGIDTDRLKEEKERGISIDLGFAHLTLPSGLHVGIVDVPGHERFVKNMLAGATGVDVALLVVAADEGVKPQTREHLAILDLLRIGRGVVALTKADLASPERLQAARAEVEALIASSALRGSPIVPVSSVTGEGVAELLQALDRAAADSRARDETGAARLPIDRAFSIEGIGTVVTGTLWNGAIRAGDSLTLLPAGLPVRVRQVEVHDHAVDAARAGQRTAVSIHGVDRDQVSRGDWLTTPAHFRASDILDARISLHASAERPLATRARVRVHLGASETLGRVVLFEGETLDPGQNALAQLRLESPIVSIPGDRIVLRSYSPAVTIAGAVVLDAHAVRRARLDGPGRARLLRIESRSLPERIAVLAADAAFAGIRDDETALRLGIDAPQVARAVATAPDLVRLKDERVVTKAVWSAALERLVAEAARYVSAHPLRDGVPKGELKSLLKRELDGPIFDEALAAVLEGKRLVPRGGDRLLPPDAAPALSPEQAKSAERILSRLAGSGFQPPDLSELLREIPSAHRPPELVRYLLESEQVVKVTSELLYTREQWREVVARVARHLTDHQTLTMADFKNLLQVSRKYSIPVLEHMDRTGLTRREGDARISGPKLKN